MSNIIIAIIVAIAWYFFAGIYIAEKDSVETWLYYFLLYVVGISWVIPFVLNKSMYGPYGIGVLTPERNKRWGRLSLFSIGLLISFFTSTLY